MAPTIRLMVVASITRLVVVATVRLVVVAGITMLVVVTTVRLVVLARTTRLFVAGAIRLVVLADITRPVVADTCRERLNSRFRMNIERISTVRFHILSYKLPVAERTNRPVSNRI